MICAEPRMSSDEPSMLGADFIPEAGRTEARCTDGEGHRPLYQQILAPELAIDRGPVDRRHGALCYSVVADVSDDADYLAPWRFLVAVRGRFDSDALADRLPPGAPSIRALDSP